MNQILLALDGAWKVLLVSILLGAGLPAVFAAGVRSLAYGQGGEAEVDHARPHPVGMVLAGLCFLVVLVAIGLGLTYIVSSGFGYVLSFDHVIPELKKKG